MPPKLPIFLLRSFAKTLVIDGKAFPSHRKANVAFYSIELKKNSLLNQKQTCQLLAPGHRCEAKCVIVYTYTSDWFRRKNSQPSMGIMTVYNLRSGPILAVLIHSL